MYKTEPIATFLYHQCVNVVERILKDPTHPITQKKTVKSHHNTRSSQLLEQKHTRTAVDKNHYELKEMNMSKNIQIQKTEQLQNISL